MENITNTQKSIQYKDQEYILHTQAYCVPTGRFHDYEAIAENKNGDQIKITWEMFLEYPGSGLDESEACDWDTFNVIEL